MNKKDKITLITILSCFGLIVQTLFICKLLIPRIELNSVNPKLIGTYSGGSTGKAQSVFCSFSDKSHEITETNYILCKNSDGNFYGFDSESNDFVFLDNELNELSIIKTDFSVCKITEYKDGAGILARENDKLNFYYFSPTDNTIYTILTDIQKRKSKMPVFFDTYDDLIVYTEPEGAIVCMRENDTETALVYPNRYLLCAYDSNSILVMRVINYELGFTAIEKYDLTECEFKHLRYGFFPSSSHCCLSPDKRYLISFKINRSNGEYSPVIIDLNNPVQKKISARNLDFSYSQWTE